MHILRLIPVKLSRMRSHHSGTSKSFGCEEAVMGALVGSASTLRIWASSSRTKESTVPGTSSRVPVFISADTNQKDDGMISY